MIDSTNFKRIFLPSILKSRFQNRSFTTQLKAKFIFNLNIVILGAVVLLMAYDFFILRLGLTNATDFLKIFLGQIILIIILIISLIILLRGYFYFASNLLFISCLVALWINIASEQQGFITRIDTFVLIVAALTILPFIISKSRIQILYYVILNLGVLIFFSFIVLDSILPEISMKLEFIGDLSIAFIFVGIVSFNIYKINRLSFEEAEADIREKIIAEKALLRSENKYKELAELLPQVIFETDLKGNLIYLNRNAYTMYGYENYDNVFSKINIFNTIVESDYTILKENIEKIAKGIGEESSFYTAKKKDGTQFPIQIYSNPIKAHNIVVGVRGIIIDISEQKRNEKKLEEYKLNLELLVQKRTEQLELLNNKLTKKNEQLEEKQKKLETTINELHETENKLIESDKMASLGILSAGVAHEINNPLNFIQGGAMALELYVYDNLKSHMDSIKPILEGINTGVSRVSKIVESLSHFSRDNDSFSEECNIIDIIENCLVMLQNELKFVINVEKIYNINPFIINGNEGKLHQVFLNILVNAYQSIDGKGNILIKTLKENSKSVISITYDGAGIEQEHLQKIFNPFFTTKDPGKGTGLGLSITYQIIKEHKGSIEYKSVVNKGTTVIITF